MPPYTQVRFRTAMYSPGRPHTRSEAGDAYNWHNRKAELTSHAEDAARPDRGMPDVSSGQRVENARTIGVRLPWNVKSEVASPDPTSCNASEANGPLCDPWEQQKNRVKGQLRTAYAATRTGAGTYLDDVHVISVERKRIRGRGDLVSAVATSVPEILQRMRSTKREVLPACPRSARCSKSVAPGSGIPYVSAGYHIANA
eukprot:3891048-Rhodomonas_salina.9